MKSLNLFLIFYFSHLICIERDMVIIVPSYNNKDWYELNLNSILSQNYTNYRILYIDDCSPDSTGNLVEEYKCKNDKKNKITLIKNKIRRGALANLYNAIYSCNNNEIIVILDGDDWFANEFVLSRINLEYNDPNVLVTYGSYIDLDWDSFNAPGSSLENNFCKKNYFNYVLMRGTFTPGHVKTFYAHIFKRIEFNDFLFEGDFYPIDYDIAINSPIFKMCVNNFRFIPELLYIHNVMSPINDHKCQPADLSKKVLHNLCRRDLSKYDPVNLNEEVSFIEKNLIPTICLVLTESQQVNYLKSNLINEVYVLNDDYKTNIDFIDKIHSNFILFDPLNQIEDCKFDINLIIKGFKLVRGLCGFLLKSNLKKGNYLGLNFEFKFYLIQNNLFESELVLYSKESLKKILNTSNNYKNNKFDIYLSAS